MPYVPGCKHDLFLSYSHAESAWVDAFSALLTQAVLEKLGSSPDIWHDVNNIRFGNIWTDEIKNAIGTAAAFLAVCSPSYFAPASKWCALEYSEFDPSGTLDGLMIGRHSRFLKVIKTPLLDSVSKGFYPRLQHIQFFNKAKEEYLAGSNDFTFNVHQVASAIAELLRTMRNSKQALYLAASADLDSEWTQLYNQFLDYGYDIRPQARLTPALKSLVPEELEHSMLAVFLVSRTQDTFLEFQIETAKAKGRRFVVWADPLTKQRAVSELLPKILEDAPSGSQVMTQSSIRDLIRDLVEMLRPTESRPTPKPDTVYLMHDGQPLESERIERLRTIINGRQITVLPDAKVEFTRDLHERLIRECDGLLLYRGQVSVADKWLVQNVLQVQFAEKIYDLEKPLKAKALLLANPATVAGETNLDVVPYSEPFNEILLQPFFEKMRQTRGAHAGR